jgi:hypothetical protein
MKVRVRIRIRVRMRMTVHAKVGVSNPSRIGLGL